MSTEVAGRIDAKVNTLDQAGIQTLAAFVLYELRPVSSAVLSEDTQAILSSLTDLLALNHPPSDDSLDAIKKDLLDCREYPDDYPTTLEGRDRTTARGPPP